MQSRISKSNVPRLFTADLNFTVVSPHEASFFVAFSHLYYVKLSSSSNLEVVFCCCCLVFLLLLFDFGRLDGQGGLPCCDSWGCKESNTTE